MKADTTALPTREEMLAEALREIESSPFPSNPETSAYDELSWAQHHVAKLRAIAQRALATTAPAEMPTREAVARVIASTTGLPPDVYVNPMTQAASAFRAWEHFRDGADAIHALYEPALAAARAEGERAGSLKEREERVMREWAYGNLTPLGVANHLRRAGFKIEVAIAKANALPAASPRPAEVEAAVLAEREEIARLVKTAWLTHPLVRIADADVIGPFCEDLSDTIRARTAPANEVRSDAK